MTARDLLLNRPQRQSEHRMVYDPNRYDAWLVASYEAANADTEAQAAAVRATGSPDSDGLVKALRSAKAAANKANKAKDALETELEFIVFHLQGIGDKAFQDLKLAHAILDENDEPTGMVEQATFRAALAAACIHRIELPGGETLDGIDEATYEEMRAGGYAVQEFDDLHSALLAVNYMAASVEAAGKGLRPIRRQR